MVQTSAGLTNNSKISTLSYSSDQRHSYRSDLSDFEVKLILQPDANGVLISGILHQWQELPKTTACDPLFFFRKS